jgi:hypothetical protein
VETRDAKSDAAVTARVAGAGAAFGALSRDVFGSTSVTLGTKRWLYCCFVLAVLLYGCESWCLTEVLMRKLRSFHGQCARRMCGVSPWIMWRQRLSFGKLLKRADLPPIEVYLYRRQLQYAGEVARMPPERLPRKCMSSWVWAGKPPKGKTRAEAGLHGRPVGGTEFTWGRGLNKALTYVGIDKASWYQLAQDKRAWEAMVMGLGQGTGMGAAATPPLPPPPPTPVLRRTRSRTAEATAAAAAAEAAAAAAPAAAPAALAAAPIPKRILLAQSLATAGGFAAATARSSSSNSSSSSSSSSRSSSTLNPLARAYTPYVPPLHLQHWDWAWDEPPGWYEANIL